MAANPWDNDPVVGGKTTTPAEFAQVYGAAANAAGKALGIDPSVIIGQWGLETGWGKSIVPGTNNLGNIKDFSGSGVAATDNMTGSKDKYRAYATPEEFAADYVSLIQRKYPGAQNAGADPAKFAAGLKGYAEDPRYTEKIAQATRIAGTASNPVVRGLNAAAGAVIPSAQAAQSGGGNPWDNDPIVDAAPAEQPGLLTSAAAGIGSGVGRVAMGAQHYVGKALGAVGADHAGNWLVTDAAQGRAKLAGEVAPYKAANPITTGVGELGGEIIATLPVGGLLGGAAKAAGATRLGTAIATGGMGTGATVAPGLAPAAANMVLRMAGGAINGGVTAGLIDTDSAGTGAIVGAALPPAMKAVGIGANALGSAVRPFFSSGQEKIAGNALREFSANPKNALANLMQSGPVVPGSMPTTAMAAGDDGLAALSRAMQNADPRFAAELAARQTAQNQARTTALESMAGNTGKLDIAKAARDSVTGPMRESVLNSAGKVPTDDVLASIDRLIAAPDNAGKLSQQALGEFRARIAQFSKDGAIDSRALYAIRKDINDVLGGKLQGEAGNLRYAAGQLTGVKGIIDDAIDQASKRMPSTGTALMPGGVNLSRNSIPTATSGPRSSWADYLRTYATESIPINQMERLDKIMKSVQTGSVDAQGGLIVSGAKLNNILKNEGDELAKLLDPKQLDLLRRVAADLNAGQIANTTGRAVGSNTLQNLAQNQLLTGALGKQIGGSTPATAALGRLLQLPYGTANKQIQEKLGNALLDPKEAARLLADPKSNALLQTLVNGNSRLAYRAAPAISAQ